MYLKETFEECFGESLNVFLAKFEKNDRTLQKQLMTRIQPCSDETIKSLYLTDEYASMMLRYTIDSPLSHYIDEINFRMTLNVSRSSSVLEYGVGLGLDTLDLYDLGYKNLSIADLPNKLFEMIKFYNKKMGMSIKTIEIPLKGMPKLEEYDYIICKEVLEHCWDPVETLTFLVSHLKKGGFLYLATFFNDLNGECPIHLKHLNKYQDTNLWFNEVRKLGLQDYLKDKNGILKVWRKI